MGKKTKKNQRSMRGKVERRFNIPDIKALETRTDGVEDDGIREVKGHAAVFGQTTSIGDWFDETIERGAFEGCDLTDVPLLTNHDFDKVPLARSRRNNGSSTMTLSIDDQGLLIDAKLDTRNNPEAAALYSAISRGDVDGMSFCFVVAEDTWDWSDEDHPKRTINKISKVYEVSAVTFPAYEDTDISARSDKEALDNARQLLESKREEERKAVETANEIEMLKIKNRILGG